MANKWEYAKITAMIREKKIYNAFSQPLLIWTEKDEEGKTKWDLIEDLGKKGYELVSVTPITQNYGDSCYTSYLVYTFKRPIEDEEVQIN